MPANTHQLPVGLIAGRGRPQSSAPVNVNTNNAATSGASPISPSPASATTPTATGAGAGVGNTPSITTPTTTIPPTTTSTTAAGAMMPGTAIGQPQSPIINTAESGSDNGVMNAGWNGSGIGIGNGYGNGLGTGNGSFNLPPFSPSPTSPAPPRSPGFNSYFPHGQQPPQQAYTHTQSQAQTPGSAQGQSPLLSRLRTQSSTHTLSPSGSPISVTAPYTAGGAGAGGSSYPGAAASTGDLFQTTSPILPNAAASASSLSGLRSPPRINTNTGAPNFSSGSPSSSPASGVIGPPSAGGAASIHSTGHGQGQAIGTAYTLSPLTPSAASVGGTNGNGNIATTTVEYANSPSTGSAYQAYSPGFASGDGDAFFGSASAGPEPNANGLNDAARRPWGSFSTGAGSPNVGVNAKDRSPGGGAGGGSGGGNGTRNELGLPFLTGANSAGVTPGATAPTPASPGTAAAVSASSPSGYGPTDRSGMSHSNSYDSYRSKQGSLREKGDYSQMYSPTPTSASARLGPVSASPLGISAAPINPSTTSFSFPFPRSTSPAPMGNTSGAGSTNVVSPSISSSQYPHDFSPIPRTQSPAPMHPPPPRLGTPSGARSQSPAPSTSYRRPGTAASNTSNTNTIAMASTSATAAPLSTPTPVWEITHPHAHGIPNQAQALALQTQGLTSRSPSGGQQVKTMESSAAFDLTSPDTPLANHNNTHSFRRGTTGQPLNYTGATAGVTLPAREEGMSLGMGSQSPASMRRPGPGPGPPAPMRKGSGGPGAAASGTTGTPSWIGAPGPVFREKGEDDTEEVTEIEEDDVQQSNSDKKADGDGNDNNNNNTDEDARRAERKSKRESAPPAASVGAAIAMLRRESPTRSQSGPITTVKQIDEDKQKVVADDPQQQQQQSPLIKPRDKNRDRDRGRPRTKSQQHLSIVEEQSNATSPLKGEFDMTTPASPLPPRLPADESESMGAQSRSPSRKPPTHRQRSDRGMAVGPSDPHQARSARTEDSAHQSSSKQRSQSKRNGKSPGGSHRTCRKCGQGLQGQFVRALDKTYHLECFQCHDCGDIVASKFFTMALPEADNEQVPLCETDYFRRLDLLCYSCNSALRGSYITALNHKYHIEHFTCSTCPTVFGSQDSYYEYQGQVYCHYHYFTKFAQRCNGCQSAILKQFVEIFRNGQNQHWHPECYMIHKFWNVRLAAANAISAPRAEERSRVEESDAEQKEGEDGDRDLETEGEESKQAEQDTDISEEQRRKVREQEEAMERKVFTIWSTLSTFEESSAACISDMLLHVSSGSYIDGVVVAKRFIYHVELLFRALDGLNKSVVDTGLKGSTTQLVLVTWSMKS